MKEKINPLPEIEPILVKENTNTIEPNSEDIFSLSLGKDSREIKREWQSVLFIYKFSVNLFRLKHMRINTIAQFALSLF